MPLMNNALIEELLGAANIICVEDIVASLWKCSEPEMNFEAVKKVLWPIQLAALKEDSEKGNVKHEANGEDRKKKNTKVVKGGYLGMMGDKINEFVKPLI